jgi:hypothetical protein
MKLARVLDVTNQIEKTAFFKLLDRFCSEAEGTKSGRLVDQILSEANGNIKNIDNASIEKLFLHFQDEYSLHIEKKLRFSDEQLDILVEIMVRDGNGVMSREWFGQLYKKDLTRVRANIRSYKGILKAADSSLSPSARERDYLIYRDCLRTAFENDAILNRERHISWEERTVLNTLAAGLRLSNQEVRCIRYNIIELQPLDLDDAIQALRDSGVVFVSRKSNTIYIPDEFVWLIRKIQGSELPRKFLRRLLRHLSDGEINRVARQHSIDRDLSRDEKVGEILDQGLSVNQLLTSDIFSTGATRSYRRDRVQDLMERDLQLDVSKYGRSLEQKVDTLISYFDELERDGTAALSVDGFSQLLLNLSQSFPDLNKRLKSDFELQHDNVRDSKLLSAHGITPRDVIYLFSTAELKTFAKAHEISTRGSEVAQIIKEYRNVDDLLFENIELVGARDLNGLQELGIPLKESEIGRVYEKLVQQGFEALGLNVDEKLNKELRTKRADIDHIINLGNNDIIIVECKSVKSKIYDKYSPIKRQLLAYEKLCSNAGFRVRHHLVISNAFSQDFVGDCEYDDELSLSLLTSEGIRSIVSSYQLSSREAFPIKLLMKAGLLNEARIAKVLCK